MAKKTFQNDLVDVREQKKEDGTKFTKLQFAEGVELLYKGQKVDLGKYNNVVIKNQEQLLADIDWLVKNDKIDEDKADDLAEKLKARMKEKNIKLVAKFPVEVEVKDKK